MRSAVSFFLIGVAHATLIASAAAAPLSPESQQAYDNKVKPFLKAHCFKCHNDEETRAGFRIDTLGTDFLSGKTADNWKEIYDNLGLGKMPPKKEARPKASEATAVMDWIDQEIRHAERLAKNSSGRTRRLNRTEYFATLRDLFDLDENYVRGLEVELPPDGKVDASASTPSRSRRFLPPPCLTLRLRRAFSTRMRRIASAAAAKKCPRLSQPASRSLPTSRR